MHWVAAKHVLRYPVGTMDYGLDYRRSDGISLIGFTDLDWVGYVTSQNSTFDYHLHFRFDSYVMVHSGNQKSITLSSAEARYMVSIHASCKAL